MHPSNLAGLLESWTQGLLEDIHTVSVGKIIKYYGHATRKAQVLPLINPWLSTGEVVKHKPIDDVVVVFPSTTTAGVFLPVKAGDIVLLLFAEHGIGGFLGSRDKTPVDADGVTKFSCTDCIAIPGIFPFQAVFNGEVPEGAIGVVNKGTKLIINEESFEMTDSAGNSVISSTGKITINGNLEVLQ